MPFTSGENVGPYRIIEKLGQGGMATVYKAYHAGLDRHVALKVLHAELTEDPTFIARFQREARLVAKLDHPHIVPVYDFAEYEGYPYLVMKFIEGETLKARLTHARLKPAEIVSVVEAVGSALTYAHQEGILHRDIKPSNVLLAKDGRIYLADFGLARIAQAGASTLSADAIVGTPQYISPEQALGGTDLDEGTDIYSFGVMIYELVVGRVPFSADTPFSIIHDHIYAPLPLPRSLNSSVPEEVERVLLKALAKERADRYATVAEMVAAFKVAWEAAEQPRQQAAAGSSEQLVSSSGAVVGKAQGPGGEGAALGSRETSAVAVSKRAFVPWLFIGGGIVLAVCCFLAGVTALPGVFGWAKTALPSPTPTVASTSTPFNFCLGEQTWLTRAYFPEQEIAHCWSQKHYLSDMTYSQGEWTIVMTQPVAYTKQVYLTDSQFPSGEIRKYWDQGYDITNFTYANGQWVVVMSAGTGFTNQTYFSDSAFPSAHVQDYWKKGYAITSMGYGNETWYVVMSNGTVLKKQVYFTEATFPESRVREYWNADYYITSVAYGNATWAVVMSLGVPLSNQYYYKNETFPAEGIQEDWADDFFITNLTYGDSLWLVVMSKP
ncbi:MAG: hypothetical protein Fur0043_00270 [Anaerolineales bacterium]